MNHRFAFFCSLFLICASAAIAASRPNVVLVMADDQGWGDVGYNGHPFVQTPHLDAMAANGLRFDRFYAGAPVCSPTRGSVLTGRNPNRIKILDHGHYFRPQEETIPEILRRAGYVTGHFGKWHVGSVQKESPVNPGAKGADKWIAAPNFFDLDPFLVEDGVAKQFKGESSQLVVDWTLDFLRDNAKGGKPMFAIAWFAAPHVPHVSVPPYDTLYADKTNKKMAGYYQEITAMDAQIGRLRQGLRDLGIADNTLVWFCSDNGGLNPATSGGLGKKGAIYEGGLRVPAVIEWPAVVKPAVTNVPAFTSDMLPTLVDLIGAKRGVDYPLDGVSIAPLLQGKPFKRTQPMGFWRMPASGRNTYSDKIVEEIMIAQKAGKSPAIPERLLMGVEVFTQRPTDRFHGHAAWLDFPWKLHRIEKKGDVRFKLYNLADDPNEGNDQATANAERADVMKRQLEAWLSSVINSLNGKDYTN